LAGLAVVVPGGEVREKSVAMPHRASEASEESVGIAERAVQRAAVEPNAALSEEARELKKPTARQRSRRGESSSGGPVR
jgi:hypothetical protein